MRLRDRERAGPAAGAPASTWNPAGTRFGPRRALSAAAMLAFAAVLAAEGGLAAVLAALVVVDVAVMSLPWRVPRGGRSMPSIWTENLAYLILPLGALIAALVAGPFWLGQAGSWWWYPVALAAGAGLVLGSGLDLRMLLSGELAFLVGPRPKGHAASHVLNALAGPPGEEVTFRGPVLLATGIGAVLAPALAVLAFVGRHHLPPQAGAGVNRRALATQAAAALVLLALTALSRSIYPALLAHLVNNAPQALLEWQRGWRSGDDE